MKKIPIGVADFSEIRQGGYFYADKTKFLYPLVKTNAPYFLSRPRRFGKSLLLSTLKAILEGRRYLFKGLWIDGSDYGWAPNPVISLSLLSVPASSLSKVEDGLYSSLKEIAKRDGMTLISENPGPCLKALINCMRL
jgi:hypothetical protein